MGGFSQGGAVTIYTALHTTYKINAFIPVIAWRPDVESITEISRPANWNTPILQINARNDKNILYDMALKTERDLKKVFNYHEIQTIEIGGHVSIATTTSVIRILRRWLIDNTNITP